MTAKTGIESGLVSITFRHLAPEEIIALVAEAGLRGIEWGGDVHVPHGDMRAAAAVGAATRARGLEVAAYGSYYHAGSEEGPDFQAVLDTAMALEAPVVRVWAGDKGSAESEPPERARVVADLRRIAGLAEARGIRIAVESHGGTLTDTFESAVALYDETDHANLWAYWQPRIGDGHEACLAGLRALLPRLCHLHVFHWIPPYQRLPLAEGEDRWPDYLQEAARSGRRHFAMLEFTQDDEPANFLRDAATLSTWLGRNSARGATRIFSL